MRLDKYLKVSRLIKRRTVANEACDGGRVSVNGKVAKASQDVKPGDLIELAFGERRVRVEVVSVDERRPRHVPRAVTVSRRQMCKLPGKVLAFCPVFIYTVAR